MSKYQVWLETYMKQDGLYEFQMFLRSQSKPTKKTSKPEKKEIEKL